MLPITLLLPTRNAMNYLPAHLAMMQPWLNLVEEIIVVDSDSRDGTVPFLRAHLPTARLFDHPPGLYQSWNAGIAEIKSRYTYISTIGDGITRAGLLRLHEAIQRHDADVVVSPPAFVDEPGRPVHARTTWPVHDLIHQLKLRDELVLEGVPLFLAALAYAPFAILGSSASNLYRTAALQRWPFPTDFSRNGDGAWGVMHALQVRLAIVPERVSYFRRHPRAYHAREYGRPNDQKLLDAAHTALVEYASDPAHQHDLQAWGIPEMLVQKTADFRWRARLKSLRRTWLPWILNPAAWHARTQRNAAQDSCTQHLHRRLAVSLPACRG